MTDQLIEELEYNPQSEEINCLAEAQAVASSLGRDMRHQASLVVASGRVAILTMASYFCRSTDAFAGEYPCNIDVADTVSEAQAIACRIENKGEELRAEVLVPEALKPAPVIQVTVDDSDIPF